MSALELYYVAKMWERSASFRIDAGQLFPDRVMVAAELHGRKVKKQGRGPGSLEPEESAGLDYTVMDGRTIIDVCPWLWELYSNPGLLSIARLVFQEPVMLYPEVESAINVNVLSGVGARYERHYDSQPYTVLIFLTTLNAADEGGVFCLSPPMIAPEKRFVPDVGVGVMFDGTCCAHETEPLKSNTKRGAVAMRFLPTRLKDEERPEGLNEYLYS